MALVTRLGTLISNWEAQPRILSSGYLAGANDTAGVGTVGAVSTDSIGSIYKFAKLPSGIRIYDIQLMNDATTAGVWSMGLYTNDLQSLNVSAPTSGGGQGAYPTWNSTTAYVTGNVVIFNGVIYTASAGSTGSQPPSGNWTTGGATVVPPGTLVIASAVGILGTGISTAAANATWKSVYSPAVTSGAFGAINANLRIWELLGMAQDPFYEFDLALTATTAPTANGNITLQFDWVR
jgi:hypothetical protein